MSEERAYTQLEVDNLRHQWEVDTFESKTKEVLAGISKRLDESNNYKATIGRDVLEIKGHVEQIETARKLEQEAKKDSMQWHQSWWVRIGILTAILFQGLNFLINTGAIR